MCIQVIKMSWQSCTAYFHVVLIVAIAAASIGMQFAKRCCQSSSLAHAIMPSIAFPSKQSGSSLLIAIVCKRCCRYTRLVNHKLLVLQVHRMQQGVDWNYRLLPGGRHHHWSNLGRLHWGLRWQALGHDSGDHLLMKFYADFLLTWKRYQAWKIVMLVEVRMTAIKSHMSDAYIAHPKWQ